MSSLIKWPIVQLQELAANKKYAIVGGPFGSNLVSTDYVGTGVPVVRGINLPKAGRFKCDRLAFVSEAKADSLKSNLATPGDLVFTQRGTLGQVGIIPSDTQYSRFVISQSQMKMTVDESKANPGYLYYYFRLKSTVSYIENHALQSGVPHINLGILKKLEIVKPPLQTQKKIAAVLSAYDDLIENNKRRIALLEKMAEEIYREWFVRFRFPGYQTASFEKGIPKGWEVFQIKDVVDRRKFGKIYREKDLSEEGSVIVIDQSKSDCLGFYDGKPEHQATTEQPMILFGDHSCKMLLMLRNFSLAENVIPFKPKGDMPVHFLFHLIKNRAKTTEYKRHWTDLTTQNVLIPNIQLQSQFSEQVVKLYEQVESLKAIVSNLTKTRDMLLPRLISGKLFVEDLDIQFPPSMINEAEAG